MSSVPLPQVPEPPPPQVQRFDAVGRPTQAQVTYETKLKAFLQAIKKALETP